jgi:hypothetical protein
MYVDEKSVRNPDIYNYLISHNINYIINFPVCNSYS